MNLCDFLSQKSHYYMLLKSAKMEILKHRFLDEEEVQDIGAEALKRILDYLQRNPQRIIELEEKEKLEMINYLKKSMRNQVINILKQKYREETKSSSLVNNLKKNELEKVKRNIYKAKAYSPNNLLQSSQAAGNDQRPVEEFTIEGAQKDIYFFIEEKFGREKWNYKKLAVDIFLERMRDNTNISEIKRRYPQHNIASMNAEAHRILKKYVNWLKTANKTRDEYPAAQYRE